MTSENGPALLRVSDDGGAMVVTLSGEYDAANSDLIREVFLDACGRGGHTVVANMAAVTFVDSSAIGALVGAHKALAAKACKLVLVNVSGLPLRAMRLLGLGEVWDLSTSADDLEPVLRELLTASP